MVNILSMRCETDAFYKQYRTMVNILSMRCETEAL